MCFVVFKGVEGFADRLQCLLQAIRYAKATDRYLVIDWRDPDWTHSPETPLSQYLSFEGLKTFGCHEFCEYFNAHGESLEIQPEAWRYKLTSPTSNRVIYEALFRLDENRIINEIATYQTPDFEEDVVVYSGVRHRGFVYADLAHIRLAKWIEERIHRFATEENLEAGNYDVVHLRGGSKSWNGGVVEEKQLRERIHSAWPDQQSYLDFLHEKYTSLEGGSQDLILFTDSEKLGNAWINELGVGRLLGCHFQKH